MNHKKLPSLSALCLISLFIGISVMPCFGKEVVWQPSFEVDGMESDIASTLSNWMRWGYIDKSGNFAIQPKYDLVKSFKDGITVVSIDGRYFKIDKTDKILSKNMTRVEVINETNQKRWALEAKEKAEDEKGKYKGDIFDSTGTKLLGTSSEFDIGKFSERLAACAAPPSKPTDYYGLGMNRTGYIDERGKMVIPPRFSKGEEFHKGIAQIECTGFGRAGYGVGFIDKSGELLGGHYYDCSWGFNKGLAIVNRVGKTDEDYEWGFLADSGRELMGHWTRVAEFSGKSAAVRDKTGLWGFVDKDGKAILANQFKLAGEFSENLAYIKTDRGFGFVDESGNLVIAPSFSDADNFADGLAPAAVAVSDREKIERLTTLQNWRCGFIDPSGKKIADGFFAARHFSEGLAAVSTGLKWGFIDDRGVMVIQPKFDDARSFSLGLAAVRVGDLWGFIDKSGKFELEPKFQSRDFANTVAPYPRSVAEGIVLAMGQDYFWRLYSRDGKIAFRLPVSPGVNNQPEMKNFADGLAVLQSSDYHYGYIDLKAKYVIPAKLESAENFSEGLAAVGVINPKLPLIDVEHYISPAWTCNPDKKTFGFIDRQGNFAVQPRFNQVGEFHEGLAAVGCGQYELKREGEPGAIRISQKFPGPELKAKWGFVDRLGKQAIKMEFDSTGYFSESLAPVQVGTSWGFINKSGKFVISPRFDSAKPFSDGAAVVVLNGKYGLIDHRGAFVVKPKYSLAGSFSNKRALVVTVMDSDTQVSTKDKIFSKPVKSNDDILKFLLERGSAPDDYEWAGFQH